MQHVELSPEEAEVMRDLLRHLLDELEMEVSHTATRDFKQVLKHRREILESLQLKLAAAPAAVG
jgi:hypothetical protein